MNDNVVDFKEYKRKKEGKPPHDFKQPPIDLNDLEDRLECLGFKSVTITEELEPEREFKSKFGMGQFVSFLDCDDDTTVRGWILSIEFFTGGVLYCIQSELNEKGECIIHEKVLEQDILKVEEI